jgi:hypothetical protein
LGVIFSEVEAFFLEFGENNSGFGENNLGFEENNSGFEENNLGFEENNLGFGENNSGFGENNLDFGENIQRNTELTSVRCKQSPVEKARLDWRVGTPTNF